MEIKKCERKTNDVKSNNIGMSVRCHCLHKKRIPKGNPHFSECDNFELESALKIMTGKRI